MYPLFSQINGYVYRWRQGPLCRHHERALTALEARDFGSLKRLIPEPADERLQLQEELSAALGIPGDEPFIIAS